jgi:hypothetical protein
MKWCFGGDKMINLILRYLIVVELFLPPSNFLAANSSKINAESNIKAIDQYYGRAEVNRKFETRLKAGKWAIIFQHLFYGFVDESVGGTGKRGRPTHIVVE